MYRVKQLWWALSAKPLSAEIEQEIQQLLNSAEFTLFQHFSNNDKQHAVRVYALLKRTPTASADLLAATLLHDIGKIRTRMNALDRCLIVLATRLIPARAERWGRDDSLPLGWRQSLVTKAQHPKWGAKMARAAGSSTRVVELILWHQEPLETAPAHLVSDLRQLQWADDQS